jgi:hypothetical protein
VHAIQINKQAPAAIFPADVPSPSALHVNLGLQRAIARDFVLSADLVYRHFVHVPQNGGAIDVNHFNSIRGPVISTCVGAQRNDPHALLSGPINVYEAPYRATNKGLLVRAEKRFSRGFPSPRLVRVFEQYRKCRSSPGNGFNLYNWLEPWPPAPPPVLNLASVVQLPRRVELGLNFSFSSVPPFSATIGTGSTGIDFNGDGTTGDLLPGTTVNAFNRGLGRADLVRLVDQFNQTYAGTTDSQGRAIPQLTSPASYAFGDNFHSLDLRLSRSFVFHERWRISLIGEVFNLQQGESHRL